MRAEVVFPHCFVVWALHNICIFYITLFVVFIFTVFWKVICLWFRRIVSTLFCSFSIYVYVMYLYDLFHILLLPLQTSGSMECIYVHIN